MTAERTTRSGANPDRPRVADLLPADLPDDDLVDRAYLRHLLEEQRLLRAGRPEPAEAHALPVRIRPRQPESRFASRAKVAGLVVTTLALSASVAGAAMITQHRAGQIGQAGPATLRITGAPALAGFAVDDNPPPSAAPSPTAAPAATSRPQPTRVSAGPVTTSATATPKTTPADKTAVVREFYRLVSEQPSAALRLVSPTLAGENPDNLVEAWSSMRSVQIVEISQQADGSVRAVLRMQRPDGDWLTVNQLLRLADGPVPLISEAVLLSAQPR